jgi:hypothetical protein
LFDTGFTVTGVFPDSGSGPYARPLLLWLHTSGNGNGANDIASISWCEPNQSLSPSCRLSITDITEVRIGKRTPLLLSSVAHEATDDQAFSLHSKAGSLSLFVSSAVHIHPRSSAFHSLSSYVIVYRLHVIDY